MILNGPAFFGWHRPIVLQGFLAHTPPSVSNARKMFYWADDFFSPPPPPFFLSLCSVTSAVENSAHLPRNKLLQKLKSIGSCSIVKKKNHSLWEAITSQLDVTPLLYSCIQRSGLLSRLLVCLSRGTLEACVHSEGVCKPTPASAGDKKWT